MPIRPREPTSPHPAAAPERPSRAHGQQPQHREHHGKQGRCIHTRPPVLGVHLSVRNQCVKNPSYHVVGQYHRRNPAQRRGPELHTPHDQNQHGHQKKRDLISHPRLLDVVLERDQRLPPLYARPHRNAQCQ